MPTQLQELLSQCVIEIGGAVLPDAKMDDILEVSVESSLHLPDSCTLRIHDYKFKHIDDSNYDPGKTVKVKMGFGNELQVVFEGEIVGTEMDLAGHGLATMIVRCLNLGHRLHRGKKRRTFQNVKDSDVVQQIAGEAGLSVEADSTDGTYDWICQNNQTNWEMIQMLASRNGFRAYVTGKDKLKFKKLDDNAPMASELEWGADLVSFRPRLSLSGQVNEVIVRGWDVKKKQAIIGKATTGNGEPAIGLGKKGGPAAQSAFSSSVTHSIVDSPILEQGQADKIAQSELDHRNSRFIEADGLCVGNNKIHAGKKVKVGKIGSRFTGDYYVTSATHTYTPSEGYLTQFVSSGKDPSTLYSLLDNPGGGRYGLGETNVAVALVIDNLDPENKGRIKVKYPFLSDDEGSFWIRMASPMGGADRGIYFLPEIGDEVLVAFEHGDIHRAYMIGALWNGVDAPVEGNDKAVSGSKVVRRTIKTRKGHFVEFQDTDGEELIKITTQGEHYFLLDDGNKKIEVKTKDGHKMTMDDGGKKIEVVDSVGSEKMTIACNDNSIKFECAGNFEVKAMKEIKLNGMTGIKLETPQNIEGQGMAGIKWTTGANFEVTSGANTTVQAAAQVTITAAAKAGMTAALVEIQGGLVKIN